MSEDQPEGPNTVINAQTGIRPDLAKVSKLAALIHGHHMLKTSSGTSDAHNYIELRNREHVAEYLGLTVTELDQGFEALTSALAIKRHGYSRVQIFRPARLEAIIHAAKRSRQPFI